MKSKKIGEKLKTDEQLNAQPEKSGCGDCAC